MLTSNNAIVCPRGKKGQEPILIDLLEIAQTEGRLQEIAFVTAAKAPELLAVFNRACLDVSRQSAMLELEYQMSVREANRLRAEIILDKMVGILAAKGLAKASNPAGSEDLRNAVLSMDPGYQEQLERSEQIKCVIALLGGRYDAFERAYTAVKKIMGENAYNHSMPNRNLSGDTGTNDVGEIITGARRMMTEESPAPRRAIPGFGKAKF